MFSASLVQILDQLPRRLLDDWPLPNPDITPAQKHFQRQKLTDLLKPYLAPPTSGSGPLHIGREKATELLALFQFYERAEQLRMQRVEELRAISALKRELEELDRKLDDVSSLQEDERRRYLERKAEKQRLEEETRVLKDSGKSVCLHALLQSLLLTRSPEQVQVVLIDPKAVEFNAYAKSPHLFQNGGVLTQPDEALEVLSELVVEMEARHQQFARISGYAPVHRFDKEGGRWRASLDNLLVWLKWLDDGRFEGARQIINERVFSETTKFLKDVRRQPPEAIVLNDGLEHRLDRLSSGEKSLVQLFLRIGAHMTRNTLVLVDEMDVHLHSQWQHRLLLQFKALLRGNSGMTIIATTHSVDILKGYSFEVMEPGLRKGGYLIENKD